MMMETNQRMVELVTKVVGQPRGTNLPQRNNRMPYQPRSNFPALAQGTIQTQDKNGGGSSNMSTGTRKHDTSQSGSAIQEVNHQLICYGCRNVGHMSQECPERR